MYLSKLKFFLFPNLMNHFCIRIQQSILKYFGSSCLKRLTRSKGFKIFLKLECNLLWISALHIGNVYLYVGVLNGFLDASTEIVYLIKYPPSFHVHFISFRGLLSKDILDRCLVTLISRLLRSKVLLSCLDLHF